jgi:hypothetical protein
MRRPGTVQRLKPRIGARMAGTSKLVPFRKGQREQSYGISRWNAGERNDFAGASNPADPGRDTFVLFYPGCSSFLQLA